MITVDTLGRALKKFTQINGWQAAAAFANYAFFSLFPLILLFATIASFFVDRERAGTEVLAYVQSYFPISSELQRSVFDTIGGLVRTRGPASVIAFLLLVWSAQQFFTTLIRATNQAWGVTAYNGWQLPLKCLQLLGLMVIAVLVGIGMPALARFESVVLSWLVVFTSLLVFYRLVPNRPLQFSQVWMGALWTTALLKASERLFLIYITHFAALNVVYGALGGVMALLLWIYLSGGIVLFGACLCATRSEALSG